MVQFANGTVEDLGVGTQPTPIAGATVTSRKLRVRPASFPPAPPSKNCELWVATPSEGVTAGVVALGTGGGGEEFYCASALAGGLDVVEGLIELGWKVLLYRWASPGLLPPEWSGQFQKHMQAYAALTEYMVSVHAVPGLPYRASGNSGGSSQIAFAIARWNCGQFFNKVVLTSGPPMSQLAYECLAEPDPTFVAWVDAHWPAEMQVPPEYSAVSGSLMCNAMNPAGANVNESILAPGATVSYPCEVVQLIGGMDVTSAVCQALWFNDAVQSTKSLQVVAECPHWLPSHQNGIDAILLAIHS